MKKILLVLSLVLGSLAFQANAATVNTTYNLGTLDLDSSAVVGATIAKGTTFTDTWDFVVNSLSNTGASLTNVHIGLTGLISNFAATLDGVALVLDTSNPAQQGLLLVLSNIASGPHQLIVSGTTKKTGASYGGNVVVSTVPVPAAVWLFGSALLGLAGLRASKKATSSSNLLNA